MASPFTSLITRQLENPHDAGQFFTIRRLPPKHLAAARKASQMASIADVKAIGTDFIKELRNLSADVVEQAAKADPLLTYDRLILISKGVTAWTYDVPLEQEFFEDLDDDTQHWLATEILKLAKPSLYETPAETEAARKNDSGPSTAA